MGEQDRRDRLDAGQPEAEPNSEDKHPDRSDPPGPAAPLIPVGEQAPGGHRRGQGRGNGRGQPGREQADGKQGARPASEPLIEQSGERLETECSLHRRSHDDDAHRYQAAEQHGDGQTEAQFL